MTCNHRCEPRSRNPPILCIVPFAPSPKFVDFDATVRLAEQWGFKGRETDALFKRAERIVQ